MGKYYDKDGYVIEEAFEKEIEKIHSQIENGADIEQLKKLRNKLYKLRKIYEQTGSMNTDIEIEIQCINEFLHN